MARTILVFWVYTLPFALQHTPYPLWGICMLVFILTYGFIGIEAVCVEMSDPFGDDANDFDQVNLARVRISKMNTRLISFIFEFTFFVSSCV